MHASLVDENHAPVLHGGVLFPSRCGLLIHSESACVAVCEADNLEILHVYGCYGACSRLVREYDSLGALGVLDASGRHRSTSSEMMV